MPRENSDAWRTEARVPGSRKIGASISGISSAARMGSTALAPMKAESRCETKKKLRILGGSPGFDSGPLTLAQ